MYRRIVLFLTIIFAFVFFFGADVFAAGSGTVEGYVRDSRNHEALPGANVLLVGTSMGASTDLNGSFLIANVPAGSYTIRAAYVGYKTENRHIDVKPNATVTINFPLEAVGIKGKEVVVTAQAAGQNAAINQQLSSDQIENVVSAAKIQELPDANAAESVGRLPGVFVLRSGGEGYEVSIRGMQPKYNQVTIDGITMGASNADNRSTNLSMVSSDMLGGIEVKKTVTPDMDADVIGGVVNFDMREAEVKKPGVPQLNLLIQGGYNNLPDANNKYNNYKYVGTVQDRFLHDRFGVFAQVSIERLNLTSNQLSAYYANPNNSTTQYVTTGLSLFYLPRDRQRYNGALNLDYKLPGGSIKLINFASTSNTNSHQLQDFFSISNTAQTYGLSNTGNTVNNLLDAVDYKQQLPIFHLHAKLYHTYSETKAPDNWGVSFVQSSQGLSQFVNQANINPQAVPEAANDNFTVSYLSSVSNAGSFARQREFGGSLDLTTDLNVSDAISAQIKFGGKYSHLIRSYNYSVYDSYPLDGSTALLADNLINQYFSLPMNSYTISMTHFLDPNFNYGKYLGGDYAMSGPLNPGMMSQVVNLLQHNLNYFPQGTNYYHNIYGSTIPNYSGYENHTAFYAMFTARIGNQITLIPGVRYQNLQTVYTAVRGFFTNNAYSISYEHYDTTVTKNHGYWLPDVTLRYKPLSWLDLRLSYTHTLAYPDYNSIIPKIDMNGYVINWVNFNLSPSTATNYDAYLSLYDNTIGLFTAGLFLKQVKNLIYPWTFYVSGADAVPYLPASLVPQYSPNATYEISTYINDHYTVNDYGIELDWQTHFWYLPGPLSGLVLSVNYTHIFSKASYPYTYLFSNGRFSEPIDTSFIDRLIDQPDDIANLTIGYDYKGFSVRVAFLYQSNIFTGPNFWPQLRSYTAPYRRWDLAAKQDLPWFGTQVYLNLNNITSANDVSVISGGAGVPIAEQDYGMTADLGIRWNF